jgi:transcriptional regulator with XRE-family HTH domain
MRGAEFRQRRSKLGTTPEQLAVLLKVPSATLARWERGELQIPGEAEVELMSVEHWLTRLPVNGMKLNDWTISVERIVEAPAMDAATLTIIFKPAEETTPHRTLQFTAPGYVLDSERSASSERVPESALSAIVQWFSNKQGDGAIEYGEGC